MLMEGVPTHLNAREVGQAMASVVGVKGIHDLHVCNITSGLDALSSHVVASVGADRDAVLWRLQQLLQDRFGVDHATLQVVEQRLDRVQREQSQRGPGN